MRVSFYEEILRSYKEDDSCYILTGDLGYKLFDSFKEADSSRFLDIGVAEANMVGIASGLALSGKRPYCYSITPFLTMRAYEQIRMDVAFHNLGVRLVGVGGGFHYGLEGFTHFGLEDFALMRSLPNMAVVCPADPLEARAFARLSLTYDRPIYIRLGYNGQPTVYSDVPEIELGKPVIMREGAGVVIFAIGNMVEVALKSRELLEKEGVTPTIANVHSLSPCDESAILKLASSHDVVITLEEHYLSGGLGSVVSEIISESRINPIMKRMGIDISKELVIGGSEHHRKAHGLTAESVSKTALQLLEKTG